MPVFALYDFNDDGLVAADSALLNGAEDGHYFDGASSVAGRGVLDGVDDKIKIYPNSGFQLARGTLEIQFSQAEHVGDIPNTVLSRDSVGETPGGYRIEVMPDGSVLISHESATDTVTFQTEAGFVNPGDEIKVAYSWDVASGGSVQINNLTTEVSFQDTVPAGLTMDQGANSQPWMIGAGQSLSDPNILNNLNNYFNGSVEMFSLSDTVDNYNEDPVANPDTAETDEDTPIEAISVLANDTDPDGDVLVVTGTPSAAHGTVAVNADGTLSYTPNANFNGIDTISYTITDGHGNESSSTVTVTVNPVNDGPVAVDDTETGTYNQPVVIDLIGNDADVDNANSELSIFGVPTSDDGTIEVNADGRSITFTPNDGFIGEATINYTVTDPSGLTDEGVATVTFADPARDGIVRGTEGADLINNDYIDPFDADRVDAEDAILAGDAPNDDVIRAEAGDDTVYAGLGNDTVFGGQGNDLIYGGVGDDVVHGGPGVDTLFGGADRDTFIVAEGEGAGSYIYGGGEGDDFDRLVIRGPRDSYRVVETGADSDGNGIDGRVEFLDDTGNITGTLNFENIEQVVPCFTPGTLIATPKGEVPVESLKAGDRIITRDNGIQELRWIGQRKFDWAHLTANPHLRPIMVRRGSLGNGLPERDMMLSPNHRVLVSNDRTSLYFDEHEVLVAAKHLIGGKGIFEVESIGTAYIHLMFDQHEVVLSDGAWTESFQPGDYTLQGMGNAQRNEILELFPELKTKEGLEDYTAARRTLKKHEAKLLVR